MPSRNTDIGLDAAKENSDAKDPYIEKLEKSRKDAEELFGSTSEIAKEENLVEEPKTTASGIIGAITRGAAPYVAAGTATAPLGLLGGPFSEVTVPAAFGIGATTMALSDLAVGGVNAAFGTHYTSPKEAVTHTLDYFGTPKPESKAEKIVEAVSDYATSGYGMAKGLGAAAKAMPAGKVKGFFEMMGEAPKTQAAISGISGGVGEKVKQEYGPLAGLGATLLTGIAGGAAIPALTSSAKTALSALKEVDVPAIEKSLNVLKAFVGSKTETPKLAETAKKALSGNKEAQSLLAQAGAGTTPGITAATSKLGFQEVPTQFTSISPEYQALSQRATTAAGSLVEQEQKQFLDQLKSKAREITAKAGGTEDLSSLSNDIKTSMLDKIKNLDSQDDVLYSQIRKIAKPETETNLTNALDAVKSKLKELGGNAELLSPIEKQILSALSEKEIIKGTGKAKKVVGMSKPTIEAIRTLKSKVGSILQGEKTFPNETIGNAKYYYGKLAEDYSKSIEPILLAAGQPELLKNANSIVKLRKGIEENAVNLFGDELAQSISGKISKAGTSAATGNADAIQNILKSVPEEYKLEVIGSAIRNAVTKNGEFNIDNFVNWYGGIRGQKESYKALFESLDPSIKEEMDALYTISKNVRDSLKGKIKQSEMALISDKSLSLAQKIKKYVPVALGYGAFAASHQMGVPLGLDAFIGYALHQGSKSFLTKTQRATVEALDEFLSSKQFGDLIAKSKGDPQVFSRMSSEVANTSAYQKFAKQVGPETAKRIVFEALQQTPSDRGQVIPEQQ
jgi:hypothetical protein